MGPPQGGEVPAWVAGEFTFPKPLFQKNGDQPGVPGLGESTPGPFRRYTFSPSGVSQPTEFKAWNFSLRFLTLPCLFVSAESLGLSSLGWCSADSWKPWPCPFKTTEELGSFPLSSSSPMVELGWDPFSMMITRRLFSRVRSAVTYRASPPFSWLWGGDSGGGGWLASPSPWRPLVFRLQQWSALPDTGGSIMFSGKERLLLTSRLRGQLLSA